MNKYIMPIGFLTTIITISIVIMLTNKTEEIADLKTDLEIIKTDIAEIKETLKNPRTARKRPPTPPRQRSDEATKVSVSIAGDPFLGDKKAKLVLIEYSEFQCPFCAKYFMQTFNKLKAEYIDTGKIGYTFKDFPLDFHLQAQKASESAHCAGDQGKYWEMHEKLFRNQKKLQVNHLKSFAKEMGMDTAKFDLCLNSGKYEKKVKDNFNQGRAIGIRGTPSFVLGRLTPQGKVEGVLMKGALPFESFKTIIDNELKK